MLRSPSCVRLGGCAAKVIDRRRESATGSPFLLQDREVFGWNRPPRGVRLISRSASRRRLRAQQQDVQKLLQIDEASPSQGGFLERLARAWEILFPPPEAFTSNAEIAKQRLKMILISDRCSITDDAKKKIVTNIVGALADFVEIESEEKVQLNVLADPELGTVYSVTVPVRRVKPEYQDFSRDIQNLELQSIGDAGVRTVGIKFEEQS